MQTRTMKYIFTALLILAACIVQSQTLFTYGTNSVSKEEFLRAYNKNNNGSGNNEKAYREYLALFIRFKLKVKAAYDARLDTLATQKTELSNFRNQIADGFMNDESIVQSLVEEAFQRSQKDIRVSHIYIPFTGSDTMSAYKKAMEAYGKLDQARADFATIAETYSEDPAVHTNRGDLGYITTFVLPYDLESLAYSTPKGKVSKLYRSKSAYHIFKNTAERPAAGRMKAAQILLAFRPDADNDEKTKIKNLADSIYTALQKGTSFKEMVTKYSNDNISYQAGGLLPEFGVGKYSADFENAAFSLANDGDISKPILTSYGYHILQRIERVPVNTDKRKADAMAILKQAVMADNRITISKKALATKMIKTGGYKKAAYPDKALWVYMDSIYHGNKAPQLAAMNDKTLLFSFPKQKVNAVDLARYINSVRNMPDIMRGKSMPQLLQDYTETVAMEYYHNNMERFNKEFAYQLNEFKDGNLLFEAMQRQVWDKAATDSIGLRKYYENHKNKYWWETSANVILFTCSDSLSAAKARNDFSKAPADWRTQVQNSDGTLQADSGRFELTQLPVAVTANIKEGHTSEPVKTSTDNITTFVYIISIYKDRSPRNFDDAKGFVINDYQSFLEDKWIESLKKRNPVKVNEAVLQTCWK
jgi:peptidyl-prolyl cis-trans isomerase SurA